MLGSFLILASDTKVWDVLRPLIKFSEHYALYINCLVLIISLFILVIAVKAYIKNKSKRFMFLTVAFGLFAAKWIIKLIDLFVSPGFFFSSPVETFFELAIFAMLLLALLKK